MPMEARAIRRYLRISPRKMRLAIDAIRGKTVREALALLQYLPNRSAKEAARVLWSAYSNLQHKYDDRYIDPEQVVITKAYVDQGPIYKRIRPAPMGRAYRVRKRTSHITIVVEAQNLEEEQTETVE